jgi:hypothetical protein
VAQIFIVGFVALVYQLMGRLILKMGIGMMCLHLTRNHPGTEQACALNE